jgi:hypothetical protein
LSSQNATRAKHQIGGFIRTLSVSLLAVAAIAASLVLSRSTQGTPNTLIPAGERAPGEPSLDRIREAGL